MDQPGNDRGTDPADPHAPAAPATPARKRDHPLVYLLYLDLLLPGLLYLMAWITQAGFPARLFHAYGLYLVSPAFVTADGLWTAQNGIGIGGLVLHGVAIAWSLQLGRKWEALASAVLLALLFAFFFFGLNYKILGPLQFI